MQNSLVWAVADQDLWQLMYLTHEELEDMNIMEKRIQKKLLSAVAKLLEESPGE